MSEQGCCLQLSCMHACDLAQTVCNVCLVLANSGIKFGFVVDAVLAVCAVFVSVHMSDGSASTMSVTIGVLYFYSLF